MCEVVVKSGVGFGIENGFVHYYNWIYLLNEEHIVRRGANGQARKLALKRLHHNHFVQFLEVPLYFINEDDFRQQFD